MVKATLIVSPSDSDLQILAKALRLLRERGVQEREITNIENSIDPDNVIGSLMKWFMIR